MIKHSNLCKVIPDCSKTTLTDDKWGQLWLARQFSGHPGGHSLLTLKLICQLPLTESSLAYSRRHLHAAVKLLVSPKWLSQTKLRFGPHPLCLPWHHTGQVHVAHQSDNVADCWVRSEGREKKLCCRVFASMKIIFICPDYSVGGDVHTSDSDFHTASADVHKTTTAGSDVRTASPVINYFFPSVSVSHRGKLFEQIWTHCVCWFCTPPK